MAAKRKASKQTKATKRVSSKKSSSKKTSVGGKKLVRSSSDKMIAGVLGGLSNYLGIDSTIVRLVWIAIVAFTGFVPGVLAYGLAAIVMPEK